MEDRRSRLCSMPEAAWAVPSLEGADSLIYRRAQNQPGILGDLHLSGGKRQGAGEAAPGRLCGVDRLPDSGCSKRRARRIFSIRIRAEQLGQSHRNMVACDFDSGTAISMPELRQSMGTRHRRLAQRDTTTSSSAG